MSGPFKILWVDDEMVFLETFEEALTEEGLHVDFVSSVDDAIDMLSDDRVAYDLIIWDMSMPPGRTFASRLDTDGGLTTGRAFLDVVKRRRPGIKTLLFTNFRDLLPKWNLPEQGQFAAAKADYTPSKFVQAVKRLMG